MDRRNFVIDVPFPFCFVVRLDPDRDFEAYQWGLCSTSSGVGAVWNERIYPTWAGAMRQGQLRIMERLVL